MTIAPRKRFTAAADRLARRRAPIDTAIGEEAPPKPVRGRRPQGLALLAFAALAMITAISVLRVRTRARVLELGASITDLTDEHTRLLDERRRLEAERAYLRHPDHVQEIAMGHLAMEPAQPERIRRIEVVAAKQDKQDKQNKRNTASPSGQPDKPAENR